MSFLLTFNRFTPSSSVFIVNFEQIYAYWDGNDNNNNDDNSHDKDVDITYLIMNLIDCWLRAWG